MSRSPLTADGLEQLALVLLLAALAFFCLAIGYAEAVHQPPQLSPGEHP